ncbi:MAG: glycosyltransferase [Candidatus Wildermuthbacteria bacterium]|nr:glycosyltransferase [Candidatus Wildermuthbacteria bacterium]
MEKPRKLLFLIATLYQGGGERVVSELSLNFPSEVETTILLYERKVSYPFKGRLLDLGVPLSLNFFLRGFYFLVRFFKFKEVLKKEQPDYVVSFGNSGNMMNILANPKAIVRIDLPIGESNKGFWGFLYKVFAKFFLRRAKMVMCVSKFAAEEAVERFGVPRGKVRVVYNPVDINKIQRLSQEPLQAPLEEIFEHPVVITMGRITKQKGQQYLFRAFKSIKESIPDAKLVILGSGELQNDLSRLAKDLRIEHDVHFLGWQKNPFSFLARSRVFVLSSLWEGLPDVLLEAMACGLPVISSDCRSGPREILAPATDSNKTAEDMEIAEYGILVPVAQEELLSKAMMLVLTDTNFAYELGKKAKKRAEDFRVDKIIKQWNFLFGDIDRI